MSEAIATVEQIPDPSPPTSSPRFLSRLMRRPVAIAACVYLAILILIAIVAPIVLPHVGSEQAGDLLNVKQGPSSAHPLGTDTLGRDVLDRLLVGTRVTLVGVAEALIFVLALGVPLGLASGYKGGWVDRAVTWLADLTFSVPAIVIIIVVLSVFPENMLAGMATFGLLAAPGLMRMVRSATLAIREEQYIRAAEVSGLSQSYILTRHVLPRIAGPVIVQASFLAALALIFQTGLAFLGLLVAAPQPSWGGMITDGISVLIEDSWLIWPPGLAIAFTVVAFSLLGDAARDTATETWSSQAVRRRGRKKLAAPPAPAVEPGSVEESRLLAIAGLTIDFSSRAGATRVVEDVSFGIDAGEIVGLVGESGCGKTVTTTAILGLLASGGELAGGKIVFDGRVLTDLSEKELRRIRGSEIALVSQEPMISLDPAFRVGSQLQEAIRHNLGLSKKEARARAIELLDSVHLPDPAAVARRYPHELSGGMAQRVAIARALAGEPRLLIADEPTTALDVTVQAEILALMRELREARGMAILLVTHDWGVVADICDRVVVMYAGQVVERADLLPIFESPLHPYTKGLLSSNPHHAPEAEMLPSVLGTVPKPGAWPGGCRFHPRCSYATAACSSGPIPIEEPVPTHETRCIHFEELITR